MTRKNSVGSLRNDIDALCVRQGQFERKLNFVCLGIIIIGMTLIANFFL
jgi:hypothetical protein